MQYAISLNISSSEFADVAMWLLFRLQSPAANDYFVDLFPRDPACQIILVRCFVSFCFYYCSVLFCFVSLLILCSLLLTYLLSLVRIVRFKQALRSTVQCSGLWFMVASSTEKMMHLSVLAGRTLIRPERSIAAVGDYALLRRLGDGGPRNYGRSDIQRRPQRHIITLQYCSDLI